MKNIAIIFFGLVFCIAALNAQADDKIYKLMKDYTTDNNKTIKAGTLFLIEEKDSKGTRIRINNEEVYTCNTTLDYVLYGNIKKKTTTGSYDPGISDDIFSFNPHINPGYITIDELLRKLNRIAETDPDVKKIIDSGKFKTYFGN
jgi:hypothetical protein